jgi:hypothetical protein
MEGAFGLALDFEIPGAASQVTTLDRKKRGEKERKGEKIRRRRDPSQKPKQSKANLQSDDRRFASI